MVERVAATALADTFKPMTKEQPQPGKLRSKSWRLPIYDPNAASSPIWEKRAREYWERQERIFGLKMSDFTLLVMDASKDLPYPVITTYSMIVEVLPGKRDPSLTRTQ